MAIKAKDKLMADNFIRETKILSMLETTWQAIGGDTLQAMGAEKALRKKTKKKSFSREDLFPNEYTQTEFPADQTDYSVTMRRSHVIEVVLDAGHLESFGPGTFRKDETAKDVIKQFRTFSYEQQKYIARQNFTLDTYGW